MSLSPANDQVHQLLAGAQEVLDRLNMIFQLASSGADFVFYSRQRVKSIASIQGKVSERQRRYQAAYSISDMTDILGYRFVTLYDDQLLEVIPWALDALGSSAAGVNPIFFNATLSKSIKEVKAFPRTDNKDRMYARALDLIKERYNLEDSLVILEKPEKTHYSSLHILLNLVSHHSGKAIIVPTEIQFRTALEDIWAEISHKNEYKALKPDIWAPTIESKVKENASKVSILKKQIDGGLPGLINSIRDTTLALHEETTRVASLQYYRSGSLVVDQVVAVAQSQLSESARDLIGQYKKKLKVLAAGRHDIKGKRPCSDALTKLAKLKGELKLTADIDECVAGLLAFEDCRLRLRESRLVHENATSQTKDPVKLDELKLEFKTQARKLYNEIEILARSAKIRFKSRALFEFWLYYAARYAGLRQLEVAHLRSAYSLLEGDSAIPSDCIVRAMIPRLLAMHYWQEAEDKKKYVSDERHPVEAMQKLILDDYKAALALTVGLVGTSYERLDVTLGRPEQQALININNLVLYGADCINWSGSDGILQEFGLSRADWERLFWELHSRIDEVDPAIRINVKHSLLVGLVVLKRKSEARRLAKELDVAELPYRWRLDGFVERLHSDVAKYGKEPPLTVKAKGKKPRRGK